MGTAVDLRETQPPKQSWGKILHKHFYRPAPEDVGVLMNEEVLSPVTVHVFRSQARPVAVVPAATAVQTPST